MWQALPLTLWTQGTQLLTIARDYSRDGRQTCNRHGSSSDRCHEAKIKEAGGVEGDERWPFYIGQSRGGPGEGDI